MSTSLWVMLSVVILVAAGLAFVIGWIMGNDERDHHRIVQAVMGAGFVAVALTIIIVQAKLVVAHQNTIRCNTQLVDALAARNKAQVTVNQAGVHFHEHLLIWLDTEVNESHDVSERDATAQLKESVNELINARNASIKIERDNPLPNCR